MRRRPSGDRQGGVVAGEPDVEDLLEEPGLGAEGGEDRLAGHHTTPLTDGVSHIATVTDDVDRLAGFHRRVFDAPVLFDMEEGGGCPLESGVPV